ncbi:MAG: UDP-N-acetylmuramoyl-L-alanyl-D-glutamate--2,6-diaminopimelate ligase [Parachlamydiaceae bacterium]|nr:UDP-N-acetylmuramoyl-L-alanyl-D-glutamate--2,6-diaminopimelate ligase [Parachlamydiaceae bacterium]
MKIQELFEDIPSCLIQGSKENIIKGITSNSKEVKPGYLFIARKGQTHDGLQYIHEAIDLGAIAILTSTPIEIDEKLTCISHPDPKVIEAQLSANFYQHPSKQLFMVGITGTNGKTTTSYIVKHLLDEFFPTCGLIGTIENIVGNKHYSTTHTTPDTTKNQQLLFEMIQEGCHSAVMEVTSHALTQGRVDQIDYDVAVFTNLTQDHLDYHITMQDYCEAKSRLFQQINHLADNKWAVVNQDDPWTPSIIQECKANILSYGIEKESDLKASQLRLTDQGTYALITYQGKTYDYFCPLIGRFNFYNCLAAIGICLTKKISLDVILSKMIKLPFVKGRLQAVSNPLGLKIFVDYAHTDDALMKVLQSLKELQIKGKILVVFGCGGNRDISKRKKMAKAVDVFAHHCIVTSDNPRNEDPNDICNEIIKGFSPQASFEVEIDRFIAIKKAISIATKDDLILIAGKGHECLQIFADRTIPFDDHLISQEICQQLSQQQPQHYQVIE